MSSTVSANPEVSGVTYFSGLVAGAEGAILALAGIVPDLCADIFDHVRAGRFLEARAIQRRLTPLARTIGGQHGVPALKALDWITVGRVASHVRVVRCLFEDLAEWFGTTNPLAAGACHEALFPLRSVNRADMLLRNC